MGQPPDQRTERDLRLLKAKRALSKVTGGKDRPRLMKTRARWAMVLGTLFIILGTLLGSFLKGTSATNLLGTFIFLGIVMIGFGLVVLVAFR
jgi:hypothetical protein